MWWILALRHNLAILDQVQQRTGAKILLALKAFALWKVFPLIRETLHGVCASSPWEARLGREEFGREVHSFAAAFKEKDIIELLSISNHLVFNSFAQLERFRPLWEQEKAGCRSGCGLTRNTPKGIPRSTTPALRVPGSASRGRNSTAAVAGGDRRSAFSYPLRTSLRAAGAHCPRWWRKSSANSCRR
jgi:carboxynorspermidine decarboxylase